MLLNNQTGFYCHEHIFAFTNQVQTEFKQANIERVVIYTDLFTVLMTVYIFVSLSLQTNSFFRFFYLTKIFLPFNNIKF